MPAPREVDAYLKALPQDQRRALIDLRATILGAAPDAVEGFAYGLPGFKYRGRPLAYVGAAKAHCALYGTNADEFREQLAKYDVSKGTIRFTPERPLPKALVRKLMKSRMAAIDAAEDARRGKGASRKR